MGSGAKAVSSMFSGRTISGSATVALVVEDGVGEDGVDLRDELLELRCGGVARVGQGIGDDLLHAAGMGGEDDDVAREVDGLGDVVRDDDETLEPGGGVGGDAADFVAQGFAGEDVEGAERFVHAEDLRFHHERPRDADALLHAAGEFLGQHVAVAFESDGLDDFLEAMVFFLRGVARVFEAEQDVFANGEPGEEGEVLEDHGDAGVDALERLAAVFYDAAGRLDEAGEDAHDGGLAAAGGAEQGHDVVFLDGEVDVVEDFHFFAGLFAEGHVDAGEFDDGRGGGGRHGGERLGVTRRKRVKSGRRSRARESADVSRRRPRPHGRGYERDGAHFRIAHVM